MLEIKAKIIEFIRDNEQLFCSCSLGTYDLYGEKTPFKDEAIKGISNDKWGSVEDFCINWTLVTGEQVTVHVDD